LSTNSTAFGTVATYYCTSAKHKLSGKPKLTCLPDGSWDAPVPECVAQESAEVLPEVERPIRTGFGSRPSSTEAPKRRTPPFRRKAVVREPEDVGEIPVVIIDKIFVVVDHFYFYCCWLYFVAVAVVGKIFFFVVNAADLICVNVFVVAIVVVMIFVVSLMLLRFFLFERFLVLLLPYS
jgi:hypothetical protein